MVPAGAAESYTWGVKTAISIPDKVFAKAEALAQRLGKSRSRLYADAVSEYVANHDPDSITERLNRVVDELSAEELESDVAFVTVAARLVLQRNEWE